VPHSLQILTWNVGTVYFVGISQKELIGKAGDSEAFRANGSLVLALLAPQFITSELFAFKVQPQSCLSSSSLFSHLDSDSWRLLGL
jgi:hypothetical protein